MKSVLFILLGLGLIPCVALASSTERLETDVRQGLRAEQKVQQQIASHQAALDRLRHEIREEKLRLRWIRHQQEKIRHHLEQQQRDKTRLEETRKRVRQLRLALEPSLDEWLVRLEQEVAQDLPFLALERSQRMTQVRGVLNSAETPLSERLRRLLEALQVEAGYGQQVETTEEAIVLQGETLHGRVLRLGRLVRFFVSTDAQQVARQRPGMAWQPLTNEWATSLNRAMEMAERKRPFELVHLPVGEVAP